MRKLYQWFSQRASILRSASSGHGTSRTVRTEVTVQQEATTLLLGSLATAFDVCPLCGQKLDPAQAQQARLRLQKGATNAG
jgi:hypothetical protein